MTTEDDMAFIRDRMTLPILELEERDVILVMYSYSGVHGSAAAFRLDKMERLV